MTPRFPRALLSCLALSLALPAASCGPDFPEALFVRRFGPDTPYSAFAAGRLGVLRSTYRIRHLAIAYDVLTGRPLSPAEQAAAVAANEGLLDPDEVNAPPTTPDPGFVAWVKTRVSFGLVDGYAPAPDTTDVPDRSVPGTSYDNFVNCLDNAYATAARTLADRAAAHGPHSPEVVEWIRGQDIVFRNCGDLPASFGNGSYTPAKPAPTDIPAPVPNAPLWLAQDRAYQTAAAHFYATDFDQALAGFKAIAADRASPWSPTAEYVAARTLIREATLGLAEVNDKPYNQADRDAALEKEHVALRQAQSALQTMRSDPRMAPLRHGIDGLLDWLALRLDPHAQRLVLAGRLHAPNDPSFGQDLTDLTYLASNQAQPGRSDPSAPAAQAAKPASGLNTGALPETAMLAWLDTVTSLDESAALANWHTLHTNAWLLAALMAAAPGSPELPELMQAAAAVPKDGPAWLPLTFYRFRLLPRDAATRSALLAILPEIEKGQGPSAANLFASLDAATAPTLDAWLRSAGRIPAAEDFDGDEVDLESARAVGAAATTPDAKAADQPCGPALFEDQLPLFTPQAADALNTRMPLSVLAAAAETHVLPPNLRFALAQSTWVRAVLLNQPAVAHRMTSILAGCRAAWQPVLSAYDRANTEDARHVAGLLALMRFASTEPNVRAGEERPDGFAAYSVLRDNWWNKTVTPAIDLSQQNFSAPAPAETAPAIQPTPADRANDLLAPSPLAFLPASEKTTARTEIAKLQTVPPASDYFVTEALAWWHHHPRDPADADLLGEAMRVARNAPRTSHTPENEHALFDALHAAFPQSPWAKRYTTWE